MSGFLDRLLGRKKDEKEVQAEILRKKDGSHDHRGNAGNDRTPAQKVGDKKRHKDEE